MDRVRFLQRLRVGIAPLYGHPTLQAASQVTNHGTSTAALPRQCDLELQPRAFKTLVPVLGTFASAHARAYNTRGPSKGVINGVADTREEGVSLRWPLSNREKINLDEDLQNMMELDIFAERCCLIRQQIFTHP